MYTDTQHGRDPFEFSLRGSRLAAPCAFVPAIADDGFHRARSGRPGHPRTVARRGRRSGTARQIERLLARYFAHGCCAA